MAVHSAFSSGVFLSRAGRAVLPCALLLAALGSGCRKSEPSPGPGPAAGPADTIARVHWLGKKRLAAETNAAGLMAVWNLPESANLEAQALDKLASAPWGLPRTNAAAASAQSPVGSPQRGGDTAPYPPLVTTNPPSPGIEQPAASIQDPGSRITNPASRPPSHSLTDSLTHSLTNSLTHSLTNSLTHSLTDSLTHSLTDSLTHSLTDSLTHSLTNSLTQPPAHSPAPIAPLSPPASLLRPLLDDLVQQESYLEVRQATNGPAELAFAIRLTDERARLWETNLAAVLESLTGARPIPTPGNSRGWHLQITNHASRLTLDAPRSTLHAPPLRLELARAGEWTILGLAPEHNAVVDDFLDRVQHSHVPFAARTTDYWLEAELDLRRLAAAFPLGWQVPADCPRTSLTLLGDGQNVLTRAQLDFPKPLAAELEPWNIPTNLIHQPLHSLMAIRGLRPWLSSLPAWNGLRLGATPDQAYLWAQQVGPVFTYLAAPLPNATNVVAALTDRLLRDVSPFLVTNRMGWLECLTNSNPGSAGTGSAGVLAGTGTPVVPAGTGSAGVLAGTGTSGVLAGTRTGVIWLGAPYMAPFLEAAPCPQGDFILGGLAFGSLTNTPAPLGLIRELLTQTNLVAYEREITGARLEAWLYLGQLFRLVFHMAQLPEESPTIAWFRAAEPRLGNCLTLVTRTGPAQLTLTRTSSAGLSSLELHLLADWFESPRFPVGLHTLLAPRPPVPRPRR